MDPSAIPSTLRLYARQAAATIAATAKQAFDGGLVKSLADNFIRFAQFIVFILLWKSFGAAGADLGGMELSQLLTYTFASFAFRRQLEITSPATSCMWEGSVVGRYTRPMPIYLTYLAETIGRWWLPYLLFFTLPILLLCWPLGVDPLPASGAAAGLFALSLFLSIVVGYGVDILFAAIAMRMKNSMFMATRIRAAVYNLLSGSLIPFALFPAGLGRVFALLPFGSIASAPLTIYVGAKDPGGLLALQAFWAVAIWALAHFAYKTGEEGMVSYGG